MCKKKRKKRTENQIELVEGGHGECANFTLKKMTQAQSIQCS
jgi:hypothetical protein